MIWTDNKVFLNLNLNIHLAIYLWIAKTSRWEVIERQRYKKKKQTTKSKTKGTNGTKTHAHTQKSLHSETTPEGTPKAALIDGRVTRDVQIDVNPRRWRQLPGISVSARARGLTTVSRDLGKLGGFVAPSEEAWWLPRDLPTWKPRQLWQRASDKYGWCDWIKPIFGLF